MSASPFEHRQQGEDSKTLRLSDDWEATTFTKQIKLLTGGLCFNQTAKPGKQQRRRLRLLFRSTATGTT